MSSNIELLGDYKILCTNNLLILRLREFVWWGKLVTLGPDARLQQKVETFDSKYFHLFKRLLSEFENPPREPYSLYMFEDKLFLQRKLFWSKGYIHIYIFFFLNGKKPCIATQYEALVGGEGWLLDVTTVSMKSFRKSLSEE